MNSRKNIKKIMRNITTNSMIERLSEGDKLFQNMTSTDFMFMLILSRHVKTEKGRIYVEDLANRVHMPLRKVSKIIQQLSSQEWVTWTFDGNGDEGTYVEITESGLYATAKQKAILEEFYNNVIDQYGEKKFIDLMAGIAQLEEIMNKELQKMEG